MEMQYKQQTLHNNFMDASYASGGLQGHTWEFQWGPKGLEQAIKRIGMNPVITQNFSTDPMGRPLSMTYNGASYNGELYFHYDVQGNTSLLTDSNGNGVASFRYDLHSGQLVESWNPHDLETVNLKNARQGSVTLTATIGYLPDWGIDLTVQPNPPISIGGGWGIVIPVPGFGAFIDLAYVNLSKDCDCDLDNMSCSQLRDRLYERVGDKLITDRDFVLDCLNQNSLKACERLRECFRAARGIWRHKCSGTPPFTFFCSLIYSDHPDMASWTLDDAWAYMSFVAITRADWNNDGNSQTLMRFLDCP